MTRSVFTLVIAVFSAVSAAADAAPPRKPKVTISKATTFVTQPRLKDGSIDFAGALNREFGKGVTERNNAVVDFFRATPEPEGTKMPAAFWRLLGITAPAKSADDFRGLGRFLKDQKIATTDPRFDRILDNQGKAVRRPWKRKQYPQIAAWLDANKKGLAHVIRGTKKSRYFSPLVVTTDKPGRPSGLIGVLLPGVQQSRSFARALAARAMLHLGEGRVEAAWQDLLACHGLGRLVSQGPTLIEALVGIAIESIATSSTLAYIEHTKPTAKPVASHLKDLSRLPNRGLMADKIHLTERLMFLDTVLLVAEGKTLDEVLGFVGASKQLHKLVKGAGTAKIAWDEALRVGNRWYDRINKVTRIENRQQRFEGFAKLEAELRSLAKNLRKQEAAKLLAKPKPAGKLIGDILVTLMLPVLSAAQKAEDRVIQFQRNLQVAFALAAWRSDRGGYPKRLAVLAPKYLKSVPTDIFNGKPLNYRVTKTGYLLYSVGPNGKDDGGRWLGEFPRGDDPRVRMPRPQEKR